MSECLVTKLKGTVDDDSLLRLGEIELFKNNSAEYDEKACSFVVQWLNETGGTVEVKNGYFTDSAGEQNLGTSVTQGSEYTRRYISPGSSVYIRDFYNLKNIYIGGSASLDNEGFAKLSENSMNSEDLKKLIKYSTSTMTNFYAVGATIENIDMSWFSECTELTYLMFGDGNLDCQFATGDISNILKNTALYAFYGMNTDIVGDFDALGSITTLGSINIANNTGIYGSLEGFVANARAAGRTTGSITGSNISMTNITFNGENVGSYESAYGGFSWTESQITYKDVTIDA